MPCCGGARRAAATRRMTWVKNSDGSQDITGYGNKTGKTYSFNKDGTPLRVDDRDLPWILNSSNPALKRVE